MTFEIREMDGGLVDTITTDSNVCFCCIGLIHEMLQHPPLSGVNQFHQLGTVFQLLVCDVLITGLIHGMLSFVLQKGHLEIF